MKLYSKFKASDILAFLKSVERERADDVREVATMQRLLGVAKYAKSVTDSVGNVGTGEDDLIEYDLPNGLLKRDNDRIEFEAAIEFAANGNSKQVKAYLGATQIYDSGAQNQNDGAMVLNVTIIRTGTATQKIAVRASNHSGSSFSDTVTYTAGAVDLTAATSFKCTGEATSNDDIIQQYLTVKWFPGS